MNTVRFGHMMVFGPRHPYGPKDSPPYDYASGCERGELRRRGEQALTEIIEVRRLPLTPEQEVRADKPSNNPPGDSLVIFVSADYDSNGRISSTRSNDELAEIFQKATSLEEGWPKRHEPAFRVYTYGQKGGGKTSDHKPGTYWITGENALKFLDLIVSKIGSRQTPQLSYSSYDLIRNGKTYLQEQGFYQAPKERNLIQRVLDRIKPTR